MEVRQQEEKQPNLVAYIDWYKDAILDMKWDEEPIIPRPDPEWPQHSDPIPDIPDDDWDDDWWCDWDDVDMIVEDEDYEDLEYWEIEIPERAETMSDDISETAWDDED